MWRASADLGAASDDMARECRFRGGQRYGEIMEILGAASDVAKVNVTSNLTG